MGFVTKSVPVDHPDFGRAFPCTCQQETLAARRSAQLRQMSNLETLADKTFDTFLTSLPNLDDIQLAVLSKSHRHAWDYAQNPAGWLLLQGSVGSGKTHLAAAIANYRLALGDAVLFVTAPDLLDHLRSTYGPSSEVKYDTLFERVRNAPLLVLDDLGAESATPWAQEKLYQLINHRYVARLCTVFTTNYDLDELDPRIRSRLVDKDLTDNVRMNLPDYRRGSTTPEQGSLSDLSLYDHMRLETFDLREDSLPENERQNIWRAFETARDYAQKPENWLLFTGPHGCGKTHLAAAIANYRHDRGDRVLLVTVPDLLDYFRRAFAAPGTPSLDQRIQQLRNASLLVIDQLELGSASAWALEKIYQIVNYRYLSMTPTVFTTTQEFEEIDPLLRSRFLDTRYCKVFAIIAPDYRGGSLPKRRR